MDLFDGLSGEESGKHKVVPLLVILFRFMNDLVNKGSHFLCLGQRGSNSLVLDEVGDKVPN